jgi:hypothetical protein
MPARDAANVVAQGKVRPIRPIRSQIAVSPFVVRRACPRFTDQAKAKTTFILSSSLQFPIDRFDP